MMVPFIISEESVNQLKRLMARTPEARPGQGIRIYMSGLCHGGPEWSLTLDHFEADADECCEFDGLKVMIERALLEAVGGLQVEFEGYDEDGAGGFLITSLDPEVQALYGCGGCAGGCSACAGGCGACHGDCGACHGGGEGDD